MEEEMKEPSMKSMLCAEMVRRQGYVVLYNVVKPQQCEEAKKQLWSIVEALPRKKEFKLTRPKADVLTKAEKKHLGQHWIPHKSFGAPCEPPMFHLKSFYDIRQDPAVYGIFAELLGQKELYTELNRPKMVLPGYGDEELCHWDADPFFWDNDGKADSLGFHCLVAFSDIKTVFSTEPTWTKEWVSKFRQDYAHLKKKNPQAKVQIGEKDPWDLKNKWQQIHVPAGAMIIWSNKLLHSSYKNKTDQIIYGMYHGYQKAEDRPEMANTELGLTQTEDRLRAYRTGQMPFRYPSADRTHYIPAKWGNFPKIVKAYQSRMPDDHKQAQETRQVQSGPNKGKEVPFMYEPLPSNYQPPPLTILGKRLMGLEPWPSSKDSENKIKTEPRRKKTKVE